MIVKAKKSNSYMDSMSMEAENPLIKQTFKQFDHLAQTIYFKDF